MLDWINAYLPSGSRIFTTAVRPDSKKFKVTSAGKQDITEDFYESILKNYDYILITSICRLRFRFRFRFRLRLRIRFRWRRFQ